MAWYVIQTYTGGEEKLVEMVRRIVPTQHYGECFVAYAEQLRHRQQENQIHVLRLFPGYVFISSGDIEQLFRHLKKVPAMTKIMSTDDFAFTPLCDGEAEFLLGIMDADHIVRLSYVATDGRDHVSYLSGPLERCRDQICSYRFRKRYAAVRLLIEGREKEVKLGIILNDDVRRELAYGRVEAAVELPEKYSIWREDRSSGRDGISETGDRNPENRADKADREPGSPADAEGSVLGQAGTGEWEPAAEAGSLHRAAKQKSKQKDKQKDRQKALQAVAGDRVLVMEGAFEGSVAVVSQVRKDTLRISVQMFGREIQAEVPGDSVQRIEKANS